MKLTYWIAECLNDSSAYNIRCTTKREVKERLADHYDPDGYGPVRKVTVEYNNAFDLMQVCLGEGRGYWEA